MDKFVVSIDDANYDLLMWILRNVINISNAKPASMTEFADKLVNHVDADQLGDLYSKLQSMIVTEPIVVVYINKDDNYKLVHLFTQEEFHESGYLEYTPEYDDGIVKVYVD